MCIPPFVGHGPMFRVKSSESWRTPSGVKGRSSNAREPGGGGTVPGNKNDTLVTPPLAIL